MAIGNYATPTGRDISVFELNIANLGTSYTAGKVLSEGELTITNATHETYSTGRIIQIDVIEKIDSGTLGKGALKLFLCKTPFLAPLAQGADFAITNIASKNDIIGIITIPAVLWIDVIAASAAIVTKVENETPGVGAINQSFNYKTKDATAIYGYLLANGNITYETSAELYLRIYLKRD